jgi:hypothetical protein
MKSILSAIASVALFAALTFAATPKSDCCPQGDCCKSGACCKK